MYKEDRPYKLGNRDVCIVPSECFVGSMIKDARRATSVDEVHVFGDGLPGTRQVSVALVTGYLAEVTVSSSFSSKLLKVRAVADIQVGNEFFKTCQAANLKGRSIS